MVTSTIKNNTGYDIEECCITFSIIPSGKTIQKELDWFDDGDIYKVDGQIRTSPSFFGYIKEYGREIMIEGDAKKVGTNKWEFKEVQECEDD